jgi:hypothetical protein
MLENTCPCLAAAQTAASAAADVAASVAALSALVVVRASLVLINDVGMLCWSLL